MTPRDVARLMRLGAASTPPGQRKYVSSASGRTCAIGAAALAKVAEDEECSRGPSYYAALATGSGPAHERERARNKTLDAVFQIEQALDVLPLVSDSGYYRHGDISVFSWIPFFNDMARNADPECDPRPFIADCIDAWIDHVERANT